MQWQPHLLEGTRVKYSRRRRDLRHGPLGSPTIHELRANLRVNSFPGGLRWTAFEATRPELVS